MSGDGAKRLPLYLCTVLVDAEIWEQGVALSVDDGKAWCEAVGRESGAISPAFGLTWHESTRRSEWWCIPAAGMDFKIAEVNTVYHVRGGKQ